ncbi:hypothetical protein FRC19_010275 [Serendipita sp. 401]|nr:hypothetical protein FRC19_010275 [Serendipita sp. 401]
MIYEKPSWNGSPSVQGIEDLDSIACRIYKSYSRRNGFVGHQRLSASKLDSLDRWIKLQREWDHLPNSQKVKWRQRALVGYTHQFVRRGLLKRPHVWDLYASRLNTANLPPDQALCPNCSCWMENQLLLVHILLCESKSPYTK